MDCYNDNTIKNNSINLIAVLSLVILFLFITPFACAQAAKKEKKIIRVGIYHNPPLEDYIKGKAIGLYPTLLDAIAKENNWKIDYVFGTWHAVYNQLLTNKIDILPNIIYLPERDSLVDFNKETILSMWIQLYIATNDNFKNLSDLNTKKIGVLKGGANGIAFKKIMSDFEITPNYIEFRDYESIAKAIEKGQIYMGVINNFVGNELSINYKIKKSNIFLHPNRLLFATKKRQNNDLLNVIDSQLKIWKNNKNSIYYLAIDKWITKTAQTQFNYALLKWIVIIALIIVAIIMLWIFTLRKQLSREIEKKKLKEEKIKSQNHKLLLAGKNAHFGFIDWNFKTNEIELSPEVRRIYQMPRDEKDPIGFMNSHIHPDDLKIFQDGLELASKGLKKYNVDIRVIRDDKSLVWVNAKAELIKDEKGKTERLLGTVLNITDRKETERKLFEKSQFLEKSLNQTPLAFIYFDTNSIIRSWNPSAEKIFGYTAQEAIGENIMDLIVPEDILEEITEVRDSIINNSVGRINQNDNITKSGKRITCRWYNSDIKDENNKVIGVTNLVEDITERIKSERILFEKEQEMTSIFDTVGDVIFYLSVEKDEQYKFVSVNKSFLQATGLKKEQIIGKNVEDVIPEPSLSLVRKNYTKAIKTKQNIHWEEVSEYPTGSKTGIVTILPIFDGDGNCTHLVGSVHDITERKQAEEALSANEELYRSVFENAPLGIFHFNTQGIITECNYELVRMLGSSYEKLIGLEMFKKFADKKMIEAVKETLESGTGYYEDDYTSVTGNKTTPLVIHFKAIYDVDKKVIGGIGLVEDITERLELHRSLVKSEKDLLKSQKIAQLGTYNLNLITKKFKSSNIFDAIVGLKPTEAKTFAIWRTITHPDDTPSNQKMLAHCIKTGAKFDREYRVITKDRKELKWLHGLGEIIFKDKIATRFIGTIQDITARKLIELALEDNEHKLREAHEITQLGTFVFDDSTDLFETSPICDEILGLESTYKKDIQGWINFIHPEDYDNIQELFDNSKVAIISREFRVIRPKDKKIIWVYGRAKKEFDAKGNRKLITGTIQDITERKKAEEKLRQSDAILNKLNSLVVVNDGNNNIIYVSPSAKEILGYTPETLLGKGWWQLTYESKKEAKKVQNAVHNYVYNNGSKTDKVGHRIIKTKEGVPKYIEWYISKGVGKTYINIGIDVTEKHEETKKYKTLTDTAFAGIVIVDKKGVITDWNISAERMFGYTKEEVLGCKMNLIIPKKYIKKHNEGFKNATINNKIKNNSPRITEALKKDGTIFPIEIYFNSWFQNNEIVFCAFINDITEREREQKTKEIIYNITKFSQINPRLDKFLPFVRETLKDVINTTNFFIAIYKAQKDSFTMLYRIDEEDISRDDYIYNFKRSNSLSGYVFDTKKPLLTTSNRAKKLFKKGSIVENGVKSKCWLGIPLIVEQNVIGLMVVQSYTDEKAYTQKDIALLELVASNISQVIKKERDFEKIRLLNQALIQSPESVVVTNTEGIIEYVNPAFTNLSGYTVQEAIGQNPRLLKSGDQPEVYYKNLWETINKGKIWEGEFVNKRKDGEKYLVAATISAVKNREGEITNFIAVEEDITEKRKLERDFIHAFIDAQEQEKQSFGEDLHDGISQILAAESMFIQVLIKQNKDILDATSLGQLERVREFNLSAINEARNIAHGLMSKQLKEKGLLIAVENICIDYNETKNISFYYDTADLKESEISTEIKTNIFRLAQEISTNIIRHSGANKAEVSLTKTPDNKLKLVIKDNGVGIDFEKMKREKTGAGLKNIERRVTLLNGKYNLESKKDKGTCFTITVPLENIQ